jgi:serine phosphatase RsbU (regulator of sigma subunit)
VRATLDEALRTAPAPAVAPSVRAGGEEDWTGVVQRVLDAVPGRHMVLVPLRDANGEVEDYRFVAASPSVTDLSGRSGAQVIGRRAGEVYPSVVQGPVWQAWRDALADGKARRVGPFSYEGRAGDARTETVLTVDVAPLGPGVLNTWVRHDEEARLADRVLQTERLGNLGWGEWDLVSDTVYWSEGIYAIYERDPVQGPLPRGESEQLTLPEDRPVLQQAAAAFARGETVDVVYRIRVDGRLKYVRTVADAVRDTEGRPLKVYGIIQDVTARETSRIRLAEVEQQLRDHQQLLAAEHRVAVQLQQIILPIPTAPIERPGLQVAVRYVPAEQASRVGGDWYHATTARDGSVILVVGDVAGHGIQAATAMAELRHAVAAVITTGATADPAELLSYLNELLGADPARVSTASAVAVRYEPATGVMRWAQAGHPPLLHTRAGRTVTLERPAGQLLGASRGASYDTATASLGEGDLLVLYTDGLIENRTRPMGQQLEPIIEALDRASGDGGAPSLVKLLQNFRSANPADDTCILVARPTELGSTS